MDRLDLRILHELEENARISFAEVGRRVGLSPPAVTERVQRLEADGVILGYHAHLDAAKAGRPVRAFIRLTLPGEACSRVGQLVGDMPEILECHRVTGDHSAMLRAAVGSIEEFESLVDKLVKFGKPSSSIVLSTPVRFRALT